MSKKSPSFTQEAVVFCVFSRPADLAEQWSGKIKSVGKVLLFCKKFYIFFTLGFWYKKRPCGALKV